MSSLKSRPYQKRKKYIRKKQNKQARLALALILLFLGSILVGVIIAIGSNP